MDEELSPEQLADLSRLRAQADGGEPVAGTVEQAEPFDLAADVAGLFEIGLGILGRPLPSLTEIYTPEVIQALSASIARVCNKRGWLQEGFGPYSEEIALAGIALPVAYMTWEGVTKDIAKIKGRKNAVSVQGDKPGPGGEEGGQGAGLSFGAFRAA